MKKSITWITPDYFLQVDLPVLLYLKDIYHIRWIVYSHQHSDSAKTVKEYAQKYNINVTFFCIKGHRYSPLCYPQYCKQMQILKSYNSDIYYFNIIAFPYMLFALKKYIPHNKIIFTMHHGKIHKGMQLRHLYKYYLRYLCKQNFYYQYFSESQARYFTGKMSHIFTIPLALNDFGHSSKEPPKDYVQFLSFGNIIETKNIGLLIKAACLLKERCNKPFKVKIVGHCRTWDSTYQHLIKYPEIFDLHIERVSDSEIPDLFASANYLVLPYKSVTQSGPLRIAYGYNTPVIASDLDGFKESVVENVTGLMFKSEDVESLVQVMENVIECHPKKYQELKAMQKKYVNENLKVDAVVAKYIQMFNSIDNRNEIER